MLKETNGVHNIKAFAEAFRAAGAPNASLRAALYNEMEIIRIPSKSWESRNLEAVNTCYLFIQQAVLAAVSLMKVCLIDACPSNSLV